MNTLREAAQQALEALKYASSFCDTYGEIAALEAALAEQPAEQQDQTEIAFEAWWQAHGQFHRSGGGDYEKTFAWHAWLASLACTEQPKAEPQSVGHGEPVAWMWKDGTVTSDPDRADGTWTPLYTAPQPRRRLTDEEIYDITNKLGFAQLSPLEVARAIEAAVWGDAE